MIVSSLCNFGNTCTIGWYDLKRKLNQPLRLVLDMDKPKQKLARVKQSQGRRVHTWSPVIKHLLRCSHITRNWRMGLLERNSDSLFEHSV
jgi:hypothetical protein